MVRYSHFKAVLNKYEFSLLCGSESKPTAALTPECYSRARRTLQDPERVPGALINVAKHLGNLKFRVWKKMREVVKYTPVTLDPNTAHGSLNISEGLTSMKYTDDWSQLPDNPERFDVWANVLGSEGFNSGTHFWDVQVGDNTDWDVGVLTESANRKGDIDNWSGVWYVVYKDGKYYTVSTPQPESLLIVKTKPQRIRVKLDWDKGKVSLYDLDNITHLHTFMHTFTERVFPFFGSQCVRFPLRILPMKTSVRISQ
ncbi:zinc-binding protein A33-like [Sardina pilchardus]|uniref:zinc-binding protein A33-like n=1 Tax=Sardina pilchardus TaxID=27697 RepID=UPI002E14F441